MTGDSRVRPHLADREDIVKWADRMEARSEFPRLVRSLIQRNNDQILELDMRAGEGVGLQGYDGFTRTVKGTPFVPDGEAVWELGTSSEPAAKANSDYKARSKNPVGRIPAETTFVFATPRKWPGKQVWAAEKRAEGIWADVRAFDVDDIEQALELAPAVHAGFSESVGKPAHGVQTIENWWASFAPLTVPPLDPELILAGRADQAASLLKLFEEDSRLTTIKAASIDDLMAFVVASILATHEDQRRDLLSRALIVRDAYSLRVLKAHEGLLILVPFEEDLRREALLIRTHHVIIRADDGDKPAIELPKIDQATFSDLLAKRGEKPERAADLAQAASKSIVMFQRRGALTGAAMSPPWAETLTSRVARRSWLVGRWNERRSGDTDALGILFGYEYDDVHDDLLSLNRGPDPLFVVIGDTWAVASLEDAWQYGHSLLQVSDLAAFEKLIQIVLGAVDPKLELPVSDRWMASLFGKSRIHSSDLRGGVAEVLALLGSRAESVTIGSGTIESWLRGVLWQLLKRANEDISGYLWASLTDVMPLLAEAAPEVFLEALQKGLEGDKPLVGAMFADDEGSALSVSSPHTGLLWALESLAWSSAHFGSAVEQLARLAEVDPGGRLSNRPTASLASIFRPWLPQTSVGLERRLAALDGLRTRHSSVAWSIMLTMLPEHHAVGHYSYGPKFRQWKPESSRTEAPDKLEAQVAAAMRLVEDAGSDADRWAELVTRFDDLPAEVFVQALERLEALHATPEGMAVLDRIWEPLHALVRKHQRYKLADWAMDIDRIRALSHLLERVAPSNPIATVRWLFDDQLPDLPDAPDDFEASVYMDMVAEARKEAILSLVDQLGVQGVVSLAREAQYSWYVGVAIADAGSTSSGEALLAYIDGDDPKLVEAALGWANERGSSDWSWIRESIGRVDDRPVAIARLLLASRNLAAAWSEAEKQASVDEAYWREFTPYGRRQDFALAEQASRKLLLHDRPRAALMMMYLQQKSDDIDPNLIVEGLEMLVRQPADHPDQFRVSSHEIESLLGLARKGDIDEERLALLEWRLRPALHFDAQSPVLERKLARDPTFFVDVLSLIYKPRNKDPEQLVDPAVASNAYRLLERWQVVPGSAESKTSIDGHALVAWVEQVVPLLEGADRLEVGLEQIGKILARSSIDSDGTWPPRPVRDVIERISRSELDQGFIVQVFNSRGVVSRGLKEGGDRDRKESDRYAKFADQIMDGWPRTAGILRAVADGYAADARLFDQQVERLNEGLDL